MRSCIARSGANLPGSMMTVSIIIPVRNEEGSLAECLRSVTESLTDEVLEVVIVDGMSDDGTRAIAERWARRCPRIRVMENPEKTVPFALNIGISNTVGEYIMRMDGHSTYPRDYVRRCIQAMRDSDAENVGGVFITQRNGEGVQAALVQMISTHRFGIGNARYRLRPAPRSTDTVPYGFYPRSVFESIGWFDERLTRNQDYEFNQRLIKRGGKIWLDPAIEVYYKNQATLRGLLQQALFTGKWNAWMWRVAPYCFRLRHAVPALFVLGMAVLLALSFFSSSLLEGAVFIMTLYAFLAVLAAAQQASRYGSMSTFFLLPLCFFAYHVSYGIGILAGVATVLVGRSAVGSRSRPWKGARYYSALDSKDS